MDIEELKSDIALEYHLQYNVYPSMIVMFDMCKQAIKEVNSGNFNAKISLPDGYVTGDKTELDASEIIEEFHLEFFLNEDALDGDY